MNVNKAIILAGGRGTRFLPYTKTQPKEMLAVIDKPVIQLIVEEVVASGIRDICIVISNSKEQIKRHFSADMQTEGTTTANEDLKKLIEQVNFNYVYQPSVTGTASAVELCKDWLGSQPFAVLNGDDVVFGENPALLQLITKAEQTCCSVIGVQPVSEQDICKYASCSVRQLDQNSYKLLSIVEKPTPDKVQSLLSPLGRYVFTSDIFESIGKVLPTANGERYLTDAINCLSATHDVVAYNFEGNRFDFGDKLGYVKGVTYYALHHAKYGKDYKDFVHNLLKKD